MSVVISLPFPPPLSACFTNRVGISKRTGKQFVSRVTTKRYEDWQKAALEEIREQQPQRFKGQVFLYVRLVSPDNRHRDIGNAVDKSVCDILVKAGVIVDDSSRYLRRVTYEWADTGKPCVCLISEIEPAQGALI